jgi:single-strand DNA-binding protein
MKNIVLAGNIGKDAELRSTGQGDKVAGFTVAVDDGWGDNKRTLWFDVSIWGARAEKLAPMITKGGKVCVSGDLSTREHGGKTYLTVRASEITLMSPRQEGRAQEDRRAPAGRHADMSDEIPFTPEWR